MKLFWLLTILAADLVAAGPLAVVNGASFTNALAPGAIISIFGADLARVTVSAQSTPLPTSLGSVSVMVNRRAAPLFYVSPTQINAQLPYETAPGSATVTVGDSSATVTVSAAGPGIFRLSGELASLESVPAGRIVTLYLTGQGAVNPAVASGAAAPATPLATGVLPVSATIGGQTATVQYAGLAPGFVGVSQINLQVPALAAGEYTVVVRIGGVESNALRVAVGSEWTADLKVERAGSFAFASRTFSSSTSLTANWSALPAGVHHIEAVAAEPRSSVSGKGEPGARSVIINGLKSATRYSVRLRACLDAACLRTLQNAAESVATTEEEYWRVLGTGNTFATATPLISDGNVGAYVMRYGDWAGPALSGRAQLYYNPFSGSEKGVKIGDLTAPKADSLEAVSRFTPVSGFGLRTACQPGPPGQPVTCPPGDTAAKSVALFQAVPLSAEIGGAIRLFFEANGSDGRNRIMHVDSQDGYVGRDFHRGAPTICSTLADYQAGGGCEPTVVIGVEADGSAGNPKIRDARQFKVAYPNLDGSPWNGAPGTVMWFTLDVSDPACSDYGINFGYAVWSGARWVVQYAASGCPKLLKGAQAAMPVHLGGAKYKMYYSHHPQPGPLRVENKPMRLVYGDGRSFEDWDTRDESRHVNVLWPDGTALELRDRSSLDDFVVYMPTGDPRLQVMYSNLSLPMAGGQPPFIGTLVLVNP